jgi:hypothetical protein
VSERLTTITRDSKCPLCGSGMTDYWEPHSDGDSARRSMRSNDCSNRACGLPVKFWDQPPFAAARAQAGGLTAPMTTPAWEFCCDWYRPDEIERSIAESFWRPSALGARPPENILSREFAEWLCDQYRLAMNKGIQVGKSQADSSLAAENATLKEQLAAKELECASLSAALGRAKEWRNEWEWIQWLYDAADEATKARVSDFIKANAPAAEGGDHAE